MQRRRGICRAREKSAAYERNPLAYERNVQCIGQDYCGTFRPQYMLKLVAVETNN